MKEVEQILWEVEVNRFVITPITALKLCSIHVDIFGIKPYMALPIDDQLINFYRNLRKLRKQKGGER